VPEPELLKALDLMQHRGPDASGHWRGSDVWLGHRRLAIIDLSPRGSQPMHSPDGRFVCILNGEVYNFRDVRERLERAGTTFVGDSDTEVLLHAYARWGPRALETLDGMFAFAIWDGAEKRLLLARDRFGEKPLYYAHTSDGFVFASDSKVVLALGGIAPRIDLPALVGDLVYGYQLESDTVFRGVRALPPASYAIVSGDGSLVESEAYWRRRPDAVAADGSYRAFRDRLEEQLRVAVRRRLISDRPLGVLLSGGVDSSLTAAIAAQEAQRPIDAVTIAFGDETFDESPHARAVAAHVGLRHHVLTAELNALDALPRLLWQYGVPFHDYSCIPTAAAFHAVSRESVVCLTGDGGDEMFAGYSEPLLFRWLAGYGRLPLPVRELVRLALRPGARLGRLGRRLEKWSRLGALPHDAVFAEIKDFVWNGSIPLRHPRARAELGPTFARMADVFRGTEGSPVHRYLQAHAATQFANGFLVKVDVASMASSIEARTPFLSPEIAQLAAHAPARWLLEGGEQKHVLKDLALKFLPSGAVLRTKQGFTPPLGAWMRTRLREPVERLLSPEVVAHRGLFDGAAVSRLVAAHMRGSEDRTYPLWILASLEIWWRLLIDDSAAPDLPLGELSRLEPRSSIDDVAA
jgi:asparagine synthase (glutamine-hydrolysing)